MSDRTNRQPVDCTPTANPGNAPATNPGLQAPGSSDPNQARQASAGMPSRRALETGARGWRWTLGVSLLALLPLSAVAEPARLESVEHRIERGVALVGTAATLALGSPLASRQQAQAHLHAGATPRAATVAWSDRYFDLVGDAGAATPFATDRRLPVSAQSLRLSLR